MNKKVFIVEDDENILNLMINNLNSWDYLTYSVNDWNNISKEVKYQNPDIVLCDIQLPFKDGFYWIKKIREYSKVPIIVISVSNIDNNVMHAVSLGADDYIMKPFSMNLLVAKIQALLKRVSNSENVIFWADNKYNKLTNEIQNVNGSVILTPTESSMIQILLQNINEFVPNNELLDLLWQGGNYLNDNTLNVNISRLRSKLNQIKIKDSLQNKRGVGYKMVDHE
ncbi:response regulator transcription factor [Apilactobacillus apisilvae]|uniref:Response regulator transcription factor n=1 Tax=Apilactobacillus apisilvae TaxID=2923364 RepID=A0ABY4PG01_9LACO|nr:response regulator [Apilactobacillus apisilvae]UQS84593.1 response regulator transcription factor [Apilactobacillus apisilvae]